MAEVASAYVSLLPSAKGFGSKLGGVIGGDVDKVGKTSGSRFGKVFATASMSPLRAFGAAAVGLFAVDKVKDFFGSAIDEARESQKVSALTAQVIKTTGGAANVSAKQIGNLSTAISNKVGIDDEAIQSGANMLLTFTNVRNEVGRGNKVFNEATRLATDMSVALGGDAKSAALQLGKALNDPAKGVTKLARSGVSFTEQQIKQIKAMQETGNVLGAQKIILGEVSKEFGGAAAASSTAGEKMSVAWGNLKETIGTALLPVLDSAEQTITTRIIPAVSNFVAQIQNGTGAGGQLASAVMTLVNNFGTIGPALGVVVAGITAYKIATAAAAVVTKIQAAGTVEATAAQWSLNAALTANPIGLVVVALTTLGIGLVLAYKKSQTFRNIVQAAFAVVRVAASAVASAFGKIPAAFAKVTAAASSVLSWVKGHWPALVAILTGPIGIAAALIISHWRKIASAANTMVGGVKSAFSRVVSFIRGIPGKITAALGDLGKLLYGAGQRLIGGLVEGIKSKAGAIGGAMSGIAKKIKGYLPGSPVKEGPLTSWNHGNGTSAAGRRLIASLAEGIEAGAPWIKSAMEKVLGTLSKQLDTAKSKLSDLKSQFASIKDGISQAFVGDPFSVSATTNDAGVAIAGTITSNFTKQLSDTHGTLGQLTAAFQKLKKWGLGPKFLSQLFQSGNSGLILEMASGDKGTALTDQQLFNQNATLANQLGTSVANNQLGQQINVSKRQLDRLERIDKHIQELDKKFADRINKATVTAKKGRAA